jgi:Domain of unknown function (DUF4349)
MRSLGAVLVVAVLLLAGCTAGSGASDSGGESGAAVPGTDSAAITEEDRAGQSGGAAPGNVVGPVADLADRQVVTEGTVSMTVDDPRRASQDAAALVEQAGGHVQERVEQAAAAGEPSTARLVVRVPADGLTQVLSELERLGTVESVELSSNDVTAQAQDLDARIRALEISVARLQDLLSRAQSTSDVVAAEQTLTERQSDLESLQAQRNRLADQVDLSTIRLQFVTAEAAPTIQAAGFTGGLLTGWQSVVTAVSAALLVLGVLVPWAALAAVVLALVMAARRGLQRRRVLPPPPPAGASTA